MMEEDEEMIEFFKEKQPAEKEAVPPLSFGKHFEIKALAMLAVSVAWIIAIGYLLNKQSLILKEGAANEGKDNQELLIDSAKPEDNAKKPSAKDVSELELLEGENRKPALEIYK